MINESKMKPEDYLSSVQPNWCPGCGNFGILGAAKLAFSQLELEHHQIVVVSGIGCGSKIPYWLRTYGFCGLHGRPLPVATGIKLSNPKLNVVVFAGDGDGYGEGGNHFIHSCRRNHNLTYIVHNNLVYGLTTGQHSPTSEKGFITKTSPFGATEEAFNPISMAISAGASFVARGFAGDPKHLAELIVKGIEHKGFAFIDVLQPCVTFNKINTFDWYSKRVYRLEEAGHNPANKKAAFERSLEWGDRIPIGIFYKEDKPVYDEQLPDAKIPLVEQKLEKVDIRMILERFY